MKFLFGEKSVIEAINNNLVIIKTVFLLSNKTNLINLLKKKKINFKVVDKNFFNSFNIDLNHQFIACEIESNNFYNDINSFLLKIKNKDNITLLMLDSLNDSRNFGSIIRTSYALGVDGIIYKKNNQVQINEYVEKTSLGSCFFIPLIKVSNLNQTIQVLKQNNFWIYCSSLTNNSQDYNNIQYDKKSVLIVGSEENGVSTLVEKNSDFIIKIPMKNNFDSLNVSVATGILLSKIISK